MKKFSYALLLFLFPQMNILAQEDKVFEDSVRQSILQQMEDYPQSTLKDLYKSFFQDSFGPGHLINDVERAKNYLLKELDSYTETLGKTTYPTGFRHNFYRVNLSVLKNNLIPFDVFFDAFLQSARDMKQVDIGDWRKEWKRIETTIQSMNLNLPGYENDKSEIENRLRDGQYIGHHSKIFNDTYKPHYRIISAKVYNEKLLPLLQKKADK